MLESLKDLYVNYPFLPSTPALSWFKNIKDVRLTVVLPALNPISEYNNQNNIQVWLTALDATAMVATFRVNCLQLGVQYKEIANVPIIPWTVGSPALGSYVMLGVPSTSTPTEALLRDISFPEGTPIEEQLIYELNPDVLLFMQEAPKVSYNGEEAERVLKFASGNNVTAELTTDGVALYGAAGAGTGAYTSIPDDMHVPAAKQGLGASSINGSQDIIWLVGAYPTIARTEKTTNGCIKITFSREKA